MNASARNATKRITAAIFTAIRSLTPAAVYALLNGRQIQQWLDTGDLVTVNTWLDAQGADDTLLDGYRSWAGRHIATSYRARHNGSDPVRAWVRHITTGRWIHVFVYFRNDEALTAGALAYQRTAHLVPAHALAA